MRQPVTLVEAVAQICLCAEVAWLALTTYMRAS